MQDSLHRPPFIELSLPRHARVRQFTAQCWWGTLARGESRWHATEHVGTQHARLGEHELRGFATAECYHPSTAAPLPLHHNHQTYTHKHTRAHARAHHASTSQQQRAVNAVSVPHRAHAPTPLQPMSTHTHTRTHARTPCNLIATAMRMPDQRQGYRPIPFGGANIGAEHQQKLGASFKAARLNKAITNIT